MRIIYGYTFVASSIGQSPACFFASMWHALSRTVIPKAKAAPAKPKAKPKADADAKAKPKAKAKAAAEVPEEPPAEVKPSRKSRRVK